MYLKNNILFLRKSKGLTQGQLSEILMVKRTSITNYEAGTSKPELDTLIAICKYFKVKLDDIVNSDLRKSKPINTPIITSAVSEPSHQYISAKPVTVTVDEAGTDNIVMVDVKAAAGYPQHYFEKEYIQQLPAFKLPGADFRNATFRCFQVDGDSMSDTIYPNDYVIAKYLDQHYNQIREGHIHVIVTKDAVLVKRLLNRVKERKKLVLQSDNDQYPPVEVAIEEVIEIWYVKAKLSFYLPSKRLEVHRAISALQGDMLELKDRIQKIETKFPKP